MNNFIFTLVRFVTTPMDDGVLVVVQFMLGVLLFPFAPLVAMYINFIGRYYPRFLSFENKIFFKDRWKEIDSL